MARPTLQKLAGFPELKLEPMWCQLTRKLYRQMVRPRWTILTDPEQTYQASQCTSHPSMPLEAPEVVLFAQFRIKVHRELEIEPPGFRPDVDKVVGLNGLVDVVKGRALLTDPPVFQQNCLLV